MIYLQLFYEFFKVGLFAIGGGMVTLPFLYDMAERTGWFSAELVTNMIAVGESTPGPIGINIATYAGFTTAGIPGSLIATVGEVLPSLICIIIIAGALEKYRDNRFVDAGFSTLRPAVMALLLNAGWTIMRVAILNLDKFAATGVFADLFDYKKLILLAVLIAITAKFKKLHPIVLIAFSAAAGVIFSMT